jgi:O-antigen ligase
VIVSAGKVLPFAKERIRNFSENKQDSLAMLNLENFPQNYLNKEPRGFRLNEGSAGRYEVWKANLQLLLKHPVFGTTRSNKYLYMIDDFQEEFQNRLIKTKLSEEALKELIKTSSCHIHPLPCGPWNIRSYDYSMPATFTNPHNIYLAIAVYSGFVGLVIFLIFLGFIFKNTIGSIMSKNDGGNEKIIIFSVLVAAMAGALVSDTILFSAQATTGMFWVYLGYFTMLNPKKGFFRRLLA